MEKLVLTQQKLFEILEQENDDTTMETYYNIALTGNIEAAEHMAIVAFLLLLIRYKRRKMLGGHMNPFHFFGVPDDDFKKYYELLERANLEIFKSINVKENIPDLSLIEFSEDCAFLNFWKNSYFNSLRSCENALSRDETSFLCNFIKASIVELCYINKIDIGYKIQLANYQKSLIDKCAGKEINFNKEIYLKVVEIIEKQYSSLEEQYRNINFTLASETFEETKTQVPEWTEEHDFYLRHRLFLNPLCNFDLFLESSLEDLEPLNIDKDYQDSFNEIIEEFKLCRHLTYEYNKAANEYTKRIQCMVFSYVYSILDKLAFFFKEFYDLDVDDDKVSFSQRDLFDKKFKSVDKRFRDIKNINIYPLYSIMQNVHSDQKITDSIKVVVFDFHKLRNMIEHRTICKINEEALKAHSIYLLKYIKEAILYSYMLIKSFPGDDGSHDAISALSTSYCSAIVQIEKDQQKQKGTIND